MTPEEARALEPGTTPGPWEAYDPGDGTARLYAGEGDDSRLLLHNVDSDPHTACVYFTREDGELMAAAPDMRATIAAQTWEYGVVTTRPEPHMADQEWIRWHARLADAKRVHAHLADRGEKSSIVRRPVGPTEVVE